MWLLVGLLLAAGACSDIEPIDDTAMRRETPSQEALDEFARLNAIAGRITWPETPPERSHTTSEARSAWQQSLLDSNESVREALSEPIGASGFRFPEGRLDEPIPWEFDEWRRMVRLLLVSASAAARADDQERVVSDVEGSLRFASHMEGAGGGIVGLMFARWMRSTTLDWVRQHGPRLPLRTLQRLDVATKEMGPEPVRAAYRQEYVMMATMLGDTGAMAVEIRKGGAIARMFSSIAYQPEKTKQRFHGSVVSLLDELAKPCWQRQAPDEPNGLNEPDATVRDFWRPNITGRVVHAIAAPNLSTAAFIDCHDAAETRATALVAALAAFEREHGGLPDTLTELVPD